MEKNDVFNKILSFVHDREDIRAAILNGSRCNPNAPIDDFQDYDVCLLVREPQVFRDDQSWIKQFGELITKQVNPSKGEKLFFPEETPNLTFLMLFKEGYRIDFGFTPINQLNDVLDDSLSLVLVDKDHLIGKLEEPSDKSYWIKKPVIEAFDFVTNEFWWCLTNVAKGLIREELPYVKGMLEQVVRPVFIQMIEWTIGYQYHWQINVGKFGKWIKNYLPDDVYHQVEHSYAGYQYDDLWESLFIMGKLFRSFGQELASKLDFHYPIEDDQNVMEYLEEVRKLHNK